MDVWVISDEDGYAGPRIVHDAEGTLDPEIWVAEVGCAEWPDAIYFFAELVSLDRGEETFGSCPFCGASKKECDRIWSRRGLGCCRDCYDLDRSHKHLTRS